MENIIFRAKLISNGIWVYGSYVHALQFKGKTTEHQIINFYTGTVFEVDGETVCKFTGEFDRKSEMIFEGDIVMTDDCVFIGKVKFVNAMFIIVNGERFRQNPYWTGCKVIGNVFDNPELLK